MTVRILPSEASIRLPLTSMPWIVRPFIPASAQRRPASELLCALAFTSPALRGSGSAACSWPPSGLCRTAQQEGPTTLPTGQPDAGCVEDYVDQGRKGEEDNAEQRKDERIER